MSAVLSAILPFFVLMALGVAASYAKPFTTAEPAINAFVFWIALPAFLFNAIANTDITGGIPIAFPAVALAVTSLVTLAAYAGAHYIPSSQRTSPGSFALASGYGNVGYLGVPIVIALVGDAAALAAGIGQLVHNLLFMIGYPLMRIAVTRPRDEHARRFPVWLIVKRAILANPVALGLVAGLLVAVTHVPIPGVLHASVTMLGQAAIPGAMFAIGLTLRSAFAGVRSGGVPFVAVTTATVVKMLALPAATTLAVRLLTAQNLPEPWGATLILMSAMPVSATAFVLAQQYDDDAQFVAATTVATSVAAIVLIPSAAIIMNA